MYVYSFDHITLQLYIHYVVGWKVQLQTLPTTIKPSYTQLYFHCWFSDNSSGSNLVDQIFYMISRWTCHSQAFPLFSFTVWKNGRRRPGQFYHVNDINVYLRRQIGKKSPTNKCVTHSFFILTYLTCWLTCQKTAPQNHILWRCSKIHDVSWLKIVNRNKYGKVIN